MNLFEQRHSYNLGSLCRSQLSSNPYEQFGKWLTEAIEIDPLYAHAMVLSTINHKQHPSSRTVLLKAHSSNGLVFFTNTQSAKAQEISFSPKVSLLFSWLKQERQVRMAGVVTPLAEHYSEQYFQSRPRPSQVSAFISHQSEVVENKQELIEKYDAIEKKYSKQNIPTPTHWGGYLVKVNEFEFWQGRPNRLHDRFRFRYQNNAWLIERLCP